MSNSPASLPQSTPQSVPSRRRNDLLAGLINAVVSVPDGLASAALVGVNPVYGLYTSIVAPIAGSLLASAQLMQVATTSATALAAGQAIVAQQGVARDQSLFLLTGLIGVFLVVFAMLKLGRLVRFVSHSVMTGFLAGVAVVLVMDQLAPLVGYTPSGGNEVVQFIDLLRHASQFDLPTMLVGALALLIALGLARTRFATVASLVALVVPSLLVALLGWKSPQLVVDVSPIPRGIPLPALPNLAALTPDLLMSALAIAVVASVQGAGVSQSVVNPDGRPINPSRDMLAQGVANIGSGLFQGIPAGGSVGQTALNVSVGAQTRWAGVFGGLWMLALVVFIPGLVGQVPMAVLGALMILAGFSALDLAELRSIWSTNAAARASLLVTFCATLFLPVAAAVAVGVFLTIFLYLASAASDVTIKQVQEKGDGKLEEIPPPKELPSDRVTMLDVYGSLFYAGARTLQEHLPQVGAAQRPVVVLRLRGRTRIGATLIEVLDTYADQLATAEGRLYLSGVEDQAAAQIVSASKLALGEAVRIYPSTSLIGESSTQAYADAQQWLITEAPRKQDS